jgi:hypothetical protein
LWLVTGFLRTDKHISGLCQLPEQVTT